VNFSFRKKKPEGEAKASVSKRERSGVAVLILLGVFFLGGLGFQYFYTASEISKYADSIREDQDRNLEIQNTIVQLKYYKDRKSKIERNYQIYNSAKEGPGKREDLAPFPEYGYENIGMRKVEVAGQSGLHLYSQKTEFQRTASAVANIESRYPLLQVSKMRLKLPEGVPPLSPEPTYLDSEVEIFNPKP
jgi:hypothetical protein